MQVSPYHIRCRLEELELCRYIYFMTKTGPTSTTTIVQDSKSGRLVTVKGAGALKGKMTISKKVDLTKPISGPSLSGKWTAKGGGCSRTTSPNGSNTSRNTSKG